MISYDQLFVLYKDCHILKKVFQAYSPADNVRHSFCTAVALRNKTGPLDTDLRFYISHGLI